MGVSTDCGTRFIAVGWLGFTNNATRWLYASIVYHMEFVGCGLVSAFSHGRVALEYGYRTWKNRRISRCLLSLFRTFPTACLILLGQWAVNATGSPSEHLYPFFVSCGRIY